MHLFQPIFTDAADIGTLTSVQSPLMALPRQRVRVDGRLFRLGKAHWYLKGLTYGPFQPNRRGEYLPERDRLRADFDQMAEMGCNAIRLYHRPPVQLLDDALEHGIRVMIDVPWEKHRCFFEDYSAQVEARATVRKTAARLGWHPGVLAISVANEIPHDIVRFYGAKRVERFIDELIDEAKSQAPDCLVTYTNYPSTEFLSPKKLDFYCANVYLHDGQTLGRYLDRLQHVAGNLPLMLGEYGVDTIRNSETAQAEQLQDHLVQVFGRGLAGSFVFSFTDEWFTGGHLIQDWAFGVTRADRTEKPAAQVVSKLWEKAPHMYRGPLPKVSVVVCSYNGASTLDECLHSLSKLEYPDYEVVLVDDGSADNTREIAARYPDVRYIHQENRGLSVARNVGAEAATGQIVAYTDSDCVADSKWLLYLVQAMENQKVDAIGGPNVPPASDSWTAKCVAASPGGPSHVMLDDRRAEHVPGCNMAFNREKLLAMGGFDPQFRQAGDDVDICWRFIDAGLHIGYAPAALVWHHRRNTVRAYLKQQAGYGRSEAMVQLKHPQRFNALGYSQWLGVIYGEGSVGLPVATPLVFHGRFGAGLFQIVYRRNDYKWSAYFTLFEWHLLALLILSLAVVYPPIALVSAGMWLLTLVTSFGAAARAQVDPDAPRRSRPLIGLLHLIQPIVRGWHRHKHRWRSIHMPQVQADKAQIQACSKTISFREHDLYFNSTDARGRENLLHELVTQAKRLNWHGDFGAEWQVHDVELLGDIWHDIRIRTATEELGWPNRFTRVRCSLHPTARGLTITAIAGIWCIAAFLVNPVVGVGLAVTATAALTSLIWRSRRHCRNAISRLVLRAGVDSGLEPATITYPQIVVKPPAKPSRVAIGEPEEEAQVCFK